MGAKERRRGIDFEREVGRILREFGFPVERILEYREGAGWDLESSSPKAGLHIKIQCKRRKRIALFTEMEESMREDDGKCGFWVLKQDQGYPMATLPLHDFLHILEHYRLTEGWRHGQNTEDQKEEQEKTLDS